VPDTIEDRAVRVRLEPKPPGVKTEDAFDSEAVRSACEPVRRRVARYVLDSVGAIAATRPERPPSLNDRAWNNWRPLVAAGGSHRGRD
jgi:hypothetical protein